MIQIGILLTILNHIYISKYFCAVTIPVDSIIKSKYHGIVYSISRNIVYITQYCLYDTILSI